MLAWDEVRECDKSNPASKSPQEILKPEQQNSAAPPAELQAVGAQLAPQVSEHHGHSGFKLFSVFGIPRETPGGKLHKQAPPYWVLVLGCVCRQQLRQAANSPFREHFAPCVPGERPQNTSFRQHKTGQFLLSDSCLGMP